jgi:hypothetical protein
MKDEGGRMKGKKKPRMYMRGSGVNLGNGGSRGV